MASAARAPIVRAPAQPRAGRWRRVWVALSLGLNLATIIAVGLGIRDRGGFTYIKAVILRDSSAHLDPATKVRTEIFNLSTVTASSRPIVFLGDSLTYEGTWNEFFETDAPVLNRGIGGETSPEILRRVPQVTALKPAAVFLMAGANDAFYLKFSPEHTADTIGRIVAEIRRTSPDTVVYVQGLLPSRAPGYVAWGDRVNRLIAGLADNRSVFFVNFRDAFMENGLLALRLTRDGAIHLNAAGYDIWKHAIAPAVADAARRRDLQVAPGAPTTGCGAAAREPTGRESM